MAMYAIQDRVVVSTTCLSMSLKALVRDSCANASTSYLTAGADCQVKRATTLLSMQGDRAWETWTCHHVPPLVLGSAPCSTNVVAEHWVTKIFMGPAATLMPRESSGTSHLPEVRGGKEAGAYASPRYEIPNRAAQKCSRRHDAIKCSGALLLDLLIKDTEAMETVKKFFQQLSFNSNQS